MSAPDPALSVQVDKLLQAALTASLASVLEKHAPIVIEAVMAKLFEPERDEYGRGQPKSRFQKMLEVAIDAEAKAHLAAWLTKKRPEIREALRKRLVDRGDIVDHFADSVIKALGRDITFTAYIPTKPGSD